MRVGILIGRFQPLHRGHQSLIEASLASQDRSYVFLGSTQEISSQNPIPWQERKSLIESLYPQSSLECIGIEDMPSDALWCRQIAETLPQDASHITLFCGDRELDSAVRSIMNHKALFPASIEVREIPRSKIAISATQIREAIKSEKVRELSEYISPESRRLIEKYDSNL